MSVNPFQAQPFFRDKNRAFWNLQFAGWAGAFMLRGISGLANGQPVSFLIPVLLSTITGYSLTLLMAVIFRMLLRQRPFVTWTVSILVVLVAAGIGAFMDAWVFTMQNRSSGIASVQLLLGADDVQAALELVFRGDIAPPADEDLLDERLRLECRLPQRGIVCWDFPPTEEMLAFLFDDRREERHSLRTGAGIRRGEEEAGAILAGLG